jgi:hypothetical protein
MVQEVGQHRWWVPFKPTILGRGSRTTGDGGGEGESSWLGGVGGEPAVRGMVVHRPGGGDGLVSGDHEVSRFPTNQKMREIWCVGREGCDGLR